MALTAQEQAQLNQLYAQGLITLEEMRAAYDGILDTTKLSEEAAKRLLEAEEKRLEESKKQLQTGNELLEVARRAYKQSTELTDDIEKQLGIRRKNNKEEREIAKLTNSVSSTLGKQIKDYNNLADVKKDIAKNESLANELQQKAQSYAVGQTETINEYNSKKQEVAQIEASITNLSGDELKNEQERLVGLYNELDGLRAKATKQQEIALNMYEQAEAIEEANAQLKIQQENIYNVGKTLGASGALVDGLGKGLQKLGVGFLAKDFDQVSESMTAVAAQGGSAFDVMGTAISGLGGALKTALSDPLVQITLIIKAITFVKDLLFTASANVNKITSATGLANSEARKLNTTFNEQMQTTDNLYINSERLRESFVALVETTGMMGVYTGEALETFTSLTGQLGLSNDQAERLTFLARQQGKATEETMENIVGVVNNFNKTNKSSFAAKEIMKDMSDVSSEIVVSLGQNPELLAEAVTKAKALGLSLEQVDKIASGLLNIESSLQAEMEAELILGKNLNLEKARALALQGDYLGLTEEIGKQEDIMNAFRNGTVLQQEAAAKALGLSRKELADMVMMQDRQKMSQEEFIATYGEQSYQQMQQLDAQQKMNEAMTSFKMQMVETLAVFQPIIEAITSIVAGLGKSKAAALLLKGVLVGLAIKGVVSAMSAIWSGLAWIPFVGPGLAVAANIAFLGAIASAASKVKSAKDMRMRSGEPAVYSDRLGGLEAVKPAPEDDVVMGPGIMDKVEAFEKGKINEKRPVSINVTTDDKAKSIDTEQIKTDLLGDLSEASNIESLVTGPIQPTITQSVLEGKRATPTSQTIIKESSSSKEMERQNRMMNEQLKTINATLKNIGGKSTDIYFDSEKVERNLQRSTAGFR